MSLRRRLLALTAATLAAGMFVLCLAGNVLLSHTITGDQHQRLGARLEAVTASLAIDRSGRLQVGRAPNDSQLDADAWIIDPGGRLLEAPTPSPGGLTAAARSLARAGRSATRTAPGGLLLGSRPVRSRGRVVATVVAGVRVADLRRLQRGVLLGSILVAVLTLTIGVLAIRRALTAALAPVAQMTRDAEEWGAHELERRFALGTGRDEITALAATLDHLLDRIAASRRHEQRFAAEVAHELRTPLAAIRGIAELAADAELEEARLALGQIEAHSVRIGRTLDTLIGVARRESRPAADGVDLEAVVAEFPGVEVSRDGDPMPRVEGDPSLIRQTLAPLIDNARRHAVRRVTIELSCAAGRAVVSVRDDGPGVAPQLGDRVFQPGVRGPDETGDGAGLGLPLAMRLADSCGGELSLGDGPGGCFVVSLPALGRGGAPAATPGGRPRASASRRARS